MLRRILALFGRGGKIIQGTSKLPEGQARKISIGDPLAGDGYDILMCRVDGELYALDSLCPHEGGRLAEGPLADGKHAVCPLHQYRFDPKTGKAVGVSCRDAKSYRVAEKDGDAEIWL